VKKRNFSALLADNYHREIEKEEILFESREANFGRVVPGQEEKYFSVKVKIPSCDQVKIVSL